MSDDSILRFPIRPQCANWWQDKRCACKADVYLFAPDGEPVPGGFYCRECADSTTKEFAEVLGEVWTTRDLIIGS